MEGVAQYDDYYLFQWPKNDLVEHMWTHIGNQYRIFSIYFNV